MNFFLGTTAGVALVACTILVIEQTRVEERSFNLLATSWNMSPPEVEVLGFDLSGKDCISLMHTTFVGPEKILSCEFDEGEWDQ